MAVDRVCGCPSRILNCISGSAKLSMNLSIAISWRSSMLAVGYARRTSLSISEANATIVSLDFRLRVRS